MKKAVVLVCFQLIMAGVFAQHPTSTIKSVTAKQLRQWIDSSKGPTIINFWASWCSPCLHELPYMEQQVAQSATPVKLLLVSLDFSAAYPKTLQAFVTKNGYKSEVVFLSDLDTKSFTTYIESKWTGTIPATIFIDNTKKYYQFIGYQLTPDTMEKALQNLLK